VVAALSAADAAAGGDLVALDADAVAIALLDIAGLGASRAFEQPLVTTSHQRAAYIPRERLT